MKNALLRVLLVVCALHLVGLGAPPLLEPDEGRYADTARELTHASSWLVPLADGLPFLDKPPLVAWLGALSIEAFGPSELSLRWIPALSGIVSALVAGWLAAQVYGSRRAAAWAALACATSPLALGVGRIFILDAPLTALMAVGLALVLRGAGVLRARPSHLVAALGGVAVGLATLVKGPVAFGLVGLGNAAALAVSWSNPEVRKRVLSPVPWLVAIAVAAPWYALLARAEPAFFKVFFLEENLKRFGGVPFEHKHGPLFFLATTAWGLSAWLLASVALLLSGRSARVAGGKPTTCDEAETRGRRTLLAYAAIVVAFFSLSSTKVETYVLPAFPALTAVIGGEIARALESGRRFELGWAFGITTVVVLLAPLVGVAFALGWIPIPEGASLLLRAREGLAGWGPPLLALAPLPFVLLAIVAARRGRPLEAALRLTLALVAALPFGTALLAKASEERSAAPIARAILAWQTAHGDATVAVYRYYYRGLPYYLDRPVVLLGDKGELHDEAVRAVPGIYIPDVLVLRPDPTSLECRLVWTDLLSLKFLAETRPLLVVVPRGGHRPDRFVSEACRLAGVRPLLVGEYGDDQLYEVVR